MELKELAKLTVKTINETPKPFKPQVTLIFPDRKWQETLHLGPYGTGPVGKPVQETTDGLWVIFDAVDVLAWLTAAGVVKIDSADNAGGEAGLAVVAVG